MHYFFYYRNTPSEPIHCIVWSKHLFNQLFGESDPDEDVSPDNEDPELGDSKKEETGNVTRYLFRIPQSNLCIFSEFIKFSISGKATKICAICVMVLTFT